MLVDRDVEISVLIDVSEGGAAAEAFLHEPSFFRGRDERPLSGVEEEGGGSRSDRSTRASPNGVRQLRTTDSSGAGIVESFLNPPRWMPIH